jgi:hypothetical protein
MARRSKNGVALLAHSRSKNGVASLAYVWPASAGTAQNGALKQSSRRRQSDRHDRRQGDAA